MLQSSLSKVFWFLQYLLCSYRVHFALDFLLNNFSPYDCVISNRHLYLLVLSNQRANAEGSEQGVQKKNGRLQNKTGALLYSAASIEQNFLRKLCGLFIPCCHQHPWIQWSDSHALKPRSIQSSNLPRREWH